MESYGKVKQYAPAKPGAANNAEFNENASRFNNNAKPAGELSGTNGFMPEKYTIVPRPKVKSEEDEIRIASEGIIPRYVNNSLQQLQQPTQQKIILKATGTAIAVAITVAEILKRRIPNLHQENRINYTTITDTFKPLDEGLEEIARERRVAVMEITLAKDAAFVDVHSAGYQEPIDQSLVKPATAEENENTRSRGGRGRGGPRRNRGRYNGEYRGNRGRQMDGFQGGQRSEGGQQNHEPNGGGSKAGSVVEGSPAPFSTRDTRRPRRGAGNMRRGGAQTRRASGGPDPSS